MRYIFSVCSLKLHQKVVKSSQKSHLSKSTDGHQWFIELMKHETPLNTKSFTFLEKYIISDSGWMAHSVSSRCQKYPRIILERR